MTANKHTPGWYCANCQRGVDAREVTFSEQHEACGRFIADDEPPSAERQRLNEAAPDLLEALTKLTSFVVTDVAESCNGNKCREPLCAGCFGEEVAEQTVHEAREALDAARAALSRVRGSE